MSDPKRKNVFISHVHEDDEWLPKLKDLCAGAGMAVRDYSINSEKPNNANDPDYIKREILRPRIEGSSTLVVLINHDTASSDWVNWEIDVARELGKTIVGVFARGATGADMPEALRECGDAAVVGWHSERVVAAINGELREWDDPETGEARAPEWEMARVRCQ